MVIFRSEVRTESTAALLAALMASRLRDRAPSHDGIISWLIDAGELEAGIADEFNDGSEPPTPIERALRRTMRLAGRAVVASWTQGGEPSDHLDAARLALAQCGAGPLPQTIRVGTPEGFAHYGVYPEAYIRAAQRFAEAKGPSRVVVFGIRSIGTALSAVVAAALEQHGCEVTTFTVRPSGHPYDRRLQFNPAWRRTLQQWRDAAFVIVDEGPGRSGSSFASVVNALATADIPTDRVVLLPSWDAPAAALLNESARDVWDRHERYVAEFDSRWLKHGPLSVSPDARLVDISAGRWRDQHGGDVRAVPVWPQHERRKYISIDESGGMTLLKFAGLGRYGRQKFERARVLAESGCTPPAEAIAHGFIAQPWMKPTAPLTWSAATSETLARYLAFVARRFPAASAAPARETLAMVTTNLREGLGTAAAHPLIEYTARRTALFNAGPVEIDGRMLPAEWMVVGNRLIKTDAFDHHADHLFPGSQDIAWDVAGTCVEFELGDEARRQFVARVAAHLGDPALDQRMPLFTIAYLAYRLGYTQTAAAAMAGSSDGAGFSRQAERFRELLRGAAAAAA